MLWKDWDPIGINDSDEGKDEYSNYANKLYQLLIEGKNKKSISDYLFHTKSVNMGIEESRNAYKGFYS